MKSFFDQTMEREWGGGARNKCLQLSYLSKRSKKGNFHVRGFSRSTFNLDLELPYTVPVQVFATSTTTFILSSTTTTATTVSSLYNIPVLTP